MTDPKTMDVDTAIAAAHQVVDALHTGHGSPEAMRAALDVMDWTEGYRSAINDPARASVIRRELRGRVGELRRLIREHRPHGRVNLRAIEGARVLAGIVQRNVTAITHADGPLQRRRAEYLNRLLRDAGAVGGDAEIRALAVNLARL